MKASFSTEKETNKIRIKEQLAYEEKIRVINIYVPGILRLAYRCLLSESFLKVKVLTVRRIMTGRRSETFEAKVATISY